MKVLSGVSGWLCLTALLSGFKSGEAVDSIARCSISLTASSTSESVSVAAVAVADASAYVCGQGTVAAASAQAIASATARAAAVAVARATVDCYSQGSANFRVNGRSLAVAYAEAYAEAYAKGIVSAQVCNKCKVSAEFVGKAWQKLFLSAVADAEINLAGSGDASAKADVFVQAIAEAVVTAYAEVLVDARAAFEDGCNGSILGVVIAGDINNPNAADCFVSVSGTDDSFARDAAAVASASISKFLCGQSTSVDVVATETAKAVAKAIAEVSVDCIIEGSAFVCALGRADVVVVARATATAIAKLVVDLALRDTACKCTISLNAVLSATETIVAQAAADAYLGVCGVATKSFFVQDLEVNIRAKIATAFAGIWAKIKTDSCSVDADIVAGVKTCKSCAANNRICFRGDNSDIAGCCDTTYSCIKRSNNLGICSNAMVGEKLTCTSD